MYRIETASRRVEKEIRDLPEAVRGRILASIASLADDPHPRGSRRLEGELKGAWRIRIGEYRVIYDVDDDRELVILHAVLHRRDAYR